MLMISGSLFSTLTSEQQINFVFARTNFLLYKKRAQMIKFQLYLMYLKKTTNLHKSASQIKVDAAFHYLFIIYIFFRSSD